MSSLSRRHLSHPLRPSPVTPLSSTSCVAPSRSASQRVSGPTLTRAERGERRCPSSATAARERAARANASAACPRRKLSKASAATPPLPPPLASAAAHPSPPPWAASAQREPMRQRPDPDASCRHRCRWSSSTSCRRSGSSPIVPPLPVTPSPLSSLSIVLTCRTIVVVGVDAAWISIVRCRRRAPQQGRATRRSSRRPNPRCRPASSPAPTTPHSCMNADGCRWNLAPTVGM